MATENLQLDNVVEIVKDDEKWLFGSVTGKYDIYGARYRECFVLDQTSEVEREGGEDGNINAIKLRREWIKKKQIMFPSFKHTFDAHKTGTLSQRYLAAFNSNRPHNSYSFGQESWQFLVNFMGPILDTAPRRDSYDYDSDEDEWTNYEGHKRREDYGCRQGCCDEDLSAISE